jgi:hypothetical protein
MPGPDNKLGTADDVQLPLNEFTRTITISNVASDTNLREIEIQVFYNTGRFNRTYTMYSYISAFN